MGSDGGEWGRREWGYPAEPAYAEVAYRSCRHDNSYSRTCWTVDMACLIVRPHGRGFDKSASGEVVSSLDIDADSLCLPN